MFKPSLIVAALGAAFSLTAVSVQAQNNDRVSVAVGHKAGAAAAVRNDVTKAGGRVLHDMSAADAMVIELPAKALAALAKNKNVDFVDAGVPRRILGGKGPRSTALTSTQTVPYGIPMVQADQVSDSAAGNRNLCIVDSGIDGTHEDLAAIPKTGENFTKSGRWDTDENSHGTHVAGTIAALNNSVGVVGVAPSGTLKLHIAKVFDAAGSASSVVIARAMLSCWQAGSNVVSMSLGGDSASPIEQRVSTLLAKKGLLLIAAAGNDGNTATSFPAGFPEVVSVAAIDANKARAGFSQVNADVELAAPGVAVQSTVPAFSQTGSSVDVGGMAVPSQSMDGSPRVSGAGALADFALGETATPGSMAGKVCLIKRGNISFAQKVVNCQASGGAGAVIFNNTAGELFGTLGETMTAIPSVGITQADGEALLAGKLGEATSVAVFGLPDLYASYNGTSMATPHASAVAALVWSLHTSCSAEQIRASLAKSAMDLGAPGRDAEFGHGLVQAKAAHDRITALGCGQ
ncbi:S8 family serine peptidase [Aquabacterium humicola]|uniref:S8 family serine peptidase n=1 Tax=Aquabacterium humicola TaxID=3237377 RepID=UPI002543A906|nr:S8 family serine peptidase [Rubrivivax pictus]